MRHIRFLIALVLAFILALSLAIPALGAPTDDSTSTASTNTITITKAKPGETYSLYKMLDLVVDDTTNPTAYTYVLRPEWNDFKTNNEEAWSSVFKVENGYVEMNGNHQSESGWYPNGSVSKFAEAAAAYATSENLEPMATVTVPPNGNTAVFTTTKAGYYLITSSLDARALVDTTPGNVTIAAKHHDNSIVKEIHERNAYVRSNNTQIGNTIEYRLTVEIYPRSVGVTIHDTMSNGLTLDPNSMRISLLGIDGTTTTDLDSQFYTIQTPPDEGDTFTIGINDSFSSNNDTAPAKNQARTVYITYSATLNKDIISTPPAIVAQTNTAKLSYGSATSVESSTTTTTHKFSLRKYKGPGSGEESDNLAGAVFQLSKTADGDPIKLIRIDNTNYRIANGNEADAVESFTTVEGERGSGDIVIWGVESRSTTVMRPNPLEPEGELIPTEEPSITYYLREVSPPSGYELLAEAIPVKVASNNTTRIDIPNETGKELPSTGGAGLYIVAGVAIVALLGFGGTAMLKRKVNGGE